MDEPRPADDAEAAPWTQARFVGAAVAMGLIAMLAVVVAVIGPADRETGQIEPAPSPAGTSSSEPATTLGESVCGLEAGEQTVPVAAPSGTRWELVGTMAAPTAPGEHGLGVVEAGFRSCFAHSPTGALYAAVNFWALGTAKPAAEVMERLAARTEHRALAIRASRASGDEPALDRATALQLVGFRFVSYDDETAAVDLAVRVANGAVAALPTPLRWEDGDWRYVVPPDGNSGVRQVPDLAGYAVWAGA